MLQLKKSIRVERFGLPVKQALVVASRLGADAVELNARTEIRAAEMSRTAVRHLLKLLADLNLKVSALHFPTRRGYEVTDDLDQRLDATRRAMSLAYELGCSVVVNQVGRIPEDESDSRWITLMQALADLGNHAQKAGAWLAAKTGTADGSELSRLMQSLPPMTIGIDYDPAELVIQGFSPDESMDQLASQVMNFRARDGVRDLSMGRGIEVQLGRGSVDWARLLGLLEEQNYQGFIAIDRQFSDQFESECGQALEFLDHLFE